MSCPFKKKPEEFFVVLEPDGKVRTYQDSQGSNIQVSLTSEEVSFLNYFDGKVFKIVDKFVQAGFELGRKTVEAEFGPTLTSAIRKLNELFPEGEAGHD